MLKKLVLRKEEYYTRNVNLTQMQGTKLILRTNYLLHVLTPKHNTALILILKRPTQGCVTALTLIKRRLIPKLDTASILIKRRLILNLVTVVTLIRRLILKLDTKSTLVPKTQLTCIRTIYKTDITCALKRDRYTLVEPKPEQKELYMKNIQMVCAVMSNQNVNSLKHSKS